MLVCQPFAHEAAGASDTRHSLRPLANRGPSFFRNPGAIAPRERLYMSYAVMPRAGGASSTPWLTGSKHAVSGILDRPVVSARTRSALLPGDDGLLEKESPVSGLRLIGDIGGTNARFAVAEGGKYRQLRHVEVD